MWTGSYFNPHPLWRGWLQKIFQLLTDRQTSIHTLCEEGDINSGSFLNDKKTSIHTLCEEGDLEFWKSVYQICVLQSTPSVKRVTSHFLFYCCTNRTSIHTLCEEGDYIDSNIVNNYQTSIHTLCEEGDIVGNIHDTPEVLLQSTPSVKRVTVVI